MMIVFDLRCADGHGFEAWFRDGASYEEQAADGAIVCPVCGSNAISKAPMAPALGGRRAGSGSAEAEPRAQALSLLRQVQRHIEQTFDHVGPRFAEEARKIHYGEAEKRNIYGDATREESKALKDEGIDVGSIPWPPKADA